MCEWMGRNMPVTLVRIRFFAKFKRLPRLKNPVDLNEKILWLKLFSDTSRWSELADKYKVRQYIEDLGLGQYLVKLYGKWDSADDVDFSELPESVIFKANNGDGKGTNLIVRDIPNADKDKLRVLFKKWLKRKHIGELAAEPHYKGITPCIIAEEVLPFSENSSSVIDYKIWCINGEPLYIRTYSDRSSDGGSALVMTYDTNWDPCYRYNSNKGTYKNAQVIDCPKNLEEMLNLAKVLSKDFPILRVDLYNINGKVFFGEMTFTSQGGMMTSTSEDFLKELGAKADISKIKRVK